MSNNNVRKQNLNQLNAAKNYCDICGKGPSAANNRSHSMRATKTVRKPNTQKVQGLIVCTRCMRTNASKTAL